MPQPANYTPTTNFAADEAAAIAGRSTVRTARVDLEFANIETTVDALCANIALLQRDDGALHDAIVTTESLAPTVKTLFGAGGITPRGAWVTATAYAVRDVVETLAPLVSYICVVAHVSGVFAADRAAGKWMVLGQEPGIGNFTSITLSTGGITLGTNNTQDLAATGNRFRDGWFGRTVTAALSMVTPLVTTGAAVNLALGINGASNWIIPAGTLALRPAADNTQDFGDPAFRIRTAFTGIIDSGIVGSLLLRTNNGTTQVEIGNSTGAVNRLVLSGRTAGGATQIYTDGADADIGIFVGTKGSGTFSVITNVLSVPVTQFQVLHTAAANRNITVTGSNGGNPKIGTTAGSLLLSSAAGPADGIIITSGAGGQIIGMTSGNLQITSNVQITGVGLWVGPNPSLQDGVGISYARSFSTRNSAGNADFALINAATINAAVDVVRVGSGSAGTIIKGRSGAGAPGVTDITAGEWTLWRDTTGATTKLYYNNAGAIQSVALA